MSVSTRRLGLLAVLTAIAMQGAEGGAPLEQTKQELEKLKAGQKAANPATASDGLKADMPAFQSPAGSLAPLELASPERQEKERLNRRNAQKNWLIDGVEKLRKDGHGRAKDSLAGESEAEEGGEADLQPDSSDSDYLLKVYDEQKKAHDKAVRTEGTSRPAPADPFAPFLQGWLGTSPARGQFFDDFVKKSDGTTVLGGGPTVAPGATLGFEQTAANAAKPAAQEAATPKPNPYLTDLLPLPPRESVQDSVRTPALTTPPSVAPAPPGSTSMAPPPEPAQPARSLPFPTISDDKKYFPQQNKF